ncbi:MAG: VCBS repeat-containing protein, partial [Myxococcota bacterium]
MGSPAECGDGSVDPGELCFGDPQVYPTGDEPHDIAIAEVDNDEALDILTVSGTTSLLSILESDGIGGYAPMVAYDGGQGPYRVRVADYDGDGDSDIVIAGEHLVTYWNQSGFLVQQTSPAGFGGYFEVNSMEVMEGNGEAVPDIVYTHAYDYTFASGSISNSRWSLTNETSIIQAGEGASGIWATEFDWDMDDYVDVIGVNQYYSEAFITTGNGSGSFGPVIFSVCEGFGLKMGSAKGDHHAYRSHREVHQGSGSEGRHRAVRR